MTIPEHINPYSYQALVERSVPYFGRNALLDKIMSWIRSNERVSITGPPCIGITSTLKLAAYNASNEGFKPIYINLRNLGQPPTYLRLFNAICTELAIPLTGNFDQDYETYCEFLFDNYDFDSDTGFKKKLILLVDEFDLIPSNEARRSIILFSTIIPFPVLLGSRQFLFDIERSLQCIESSIYQNINTVRLSPLSRQEAHEMICGPSEQAGRSLQREEDWLIEFAGTWPFFLKLACYHTFESLLHNGGIDQKNRSKLEETILNNAITYLDSQWVTLTSRQRDILVNLRTWRSAFEYADSGFIDSDLAVFLRDGYCKIVEGAIDYHCALFRRYFSYQRSTEKLVGHLLPSQDNVMQSIADMLSRFSSVVEDVVPWVESQNESLVNSLLLLLRCQFEAVSKSNATYTPNIFLRGTDLIIDFADVVIAIRTLITPLSSQSLESVLNDELHFIRTNKPKRRVVFFVWDKQGLIPDRLNFAASFEKNNSLLRIVFAP